MKTASRPTGLNVLADLGLNQDPLSQLGGLVALINQMQQPDQFNREMQLREAAQQQQATQFAGQQDLSYASLDRQTAHDQMAADQWAKEFGLRSLVAEQERMAQIEAMKQQKEISNDALAAKLLGLPADYAMLGMNVNPQALTPGLGRFAGFFNPVQQATGMPQGMNADQKVLWEARQRRYPTQTQ